ncbi:serine hydrolase domain-containing protein [Psychrobacter sp. 16-MNA-CIBAN-0192]|uniref:serine hydrolase domain-containing protein n=1 Tax=Psychrobacter sp. 16-MNA-CIBAN-0192 TaxID=3140448 RepID=UPI003333DE5B
MTNHNNNNNSHRNNPLESRLQTILSQLQLDDAPAGGALMVYQAGQCIAQASVGMAQVNMPWQPDTLSLNFSTGKGVLATLIHVLVSQNLLDYELPIAQYWTAFAANGKAEITLREVLSHQANLFAITSIDIDTETMLDWHNMVAKVAAMPVTKPDNAERYDSAYSALIYGWVLGGLIESVTHMTLANALRHYLTEPLGIADSCYFGVPAEKVGQVATLVKNFDNELLEAAGDSVNNDANTNPSIRRSKRNKPVLKADSVATLQTYTTLPIYTRWQQYAAEQNIAALDTSLNTTQISRLYFNHSALNLKNYKAALMPNSPVPIDYYDKQTLQAVLPAVNGVASAQALATIYAMLANGGTWQGKTLIDAVTFAKLSTLQVSGMDAVMPTHMDWRLGYHRLVQLSRNLDDNNYQHQHQQPKAFGHMGYNGSVAWCDPARQLSFAFVHNFDVTMLNDIRQFALTETVLSMVDEALAQ